MKPLLILSFIFALDAFAAPLPSLKIAPESITVSGVSSGAFMAVQTQVAFSSRIRGAASIAGGIYWCAEGDKNKSQTQCMMNPGKLDPAKYIQKAKEEAAKGNIDSLDHLAKAKIYLFQSKMDFIIRPESVEKLQSFFGEFVPETRIRTRIEEKAAHGFPTLNYGNPCGQMGSPWMLNCNLDLAGEILNEFYGTLEAPMQAADANSLVSFDQSLYAEKSAGMLPEGFAYIPKACRDGEECRLHVVFHGCQMNQEYLDDKFRLNSGYNRWAERNKIVVLYPSSAKSTENPYGCWDWFGFTGPDYVLKGGRQMLAIQKMLDAVAGPARIE
jgi:poly(3-hydroxybutyrate) depolymerase